MTVSSVVVVQYSAEWPAHFAAIRDELASVFAPIVVAIEHTGSTAVPGLAAKPVIDVLLGARELPDIESRITPLRDLGYQYVSKYEGEFPMRRYFVKSAPGMLRVHLHAVERGSTFWHDHMAFRDALRSDAALRSRYQSLKLQLATEYADDKAAYTAAKGPFIRAVVAVMPRGVDPG